MARPAKRPRDPNQLAKFVVDATIRAIEPIPDSDASSDAAALGRLGGLKGGRARANKLSPERRAEIAAKAAAARWAKDG